MSRNTKNRFGAAGRCAGTGCRALLPAPGAEFGGSDDAGSRMVEIQVKHEPGSRRFWKHCSAASCPERSRACCFASRQAWAWACWPTASAILSRVKIFRTVRGMRLFRPPLCAGAPGEHAFSKSPAGGGNMFNALLGSFCGVEPDGRRALPGPGRPQLP